MLINDLIPIAGLTALSCLAVFLFIVLLRLIPAVRRSTLTRRLALICAFTGFAILGTLALVTFFLSSDTATRLRAIPALILAAIALGFFLYARLAWRLRREPLRGPNCPHCRYDLTGIDPLNTCPECGHALTNPRKLYRPNIRRWATRSAALALILAIAWPIYDIVRSHGWPALVPNRALVQLLVWNVQPQPVVMEMYRRSLTLEHFPQPTRALMRSFADEYATGRSNVIRIYPLYQGSTDQQTLDLVGSWLTSTHTGEKFVAVTLCSAPPFARVPRSLDLFRSLLKDADPGIRTGALRAITHDHALPLDELLALAADPKSGLAPTELSNALSGYDSDDRALQAQLSIAANPANGWADFTTWALLCRGTTKDRSALSPLATARAAYPTPRNMPGYDPPNPNSFRTLFSPILTAALDPTDPVTANWCRGCLISLATPGPSLTPPRPIILQLIDDQLTTTKDPATRAALATLRTTIEPPPTPTP